MFSRLAVVLPLLAVSLPALAAADLSTSMSGPSSTLVYDSGTYAVTVTNVGNQTANGVTVNIQLPLTHTSPTVYLMGTLDGYSAGCTRTGNQLNCNLGTIKRGKSASVSLDMSLPWSAAALTFTATAATTSPEPNTSNNADSLDATLSWYDVPITGPLDVVNSHCTGTSLTAWYECTLFPSAISTHDTTLESDGSISFSVPGYSGAWWQTSDDALSFEYYDSLGATVAIFEGNGVDGDCFEGLTTFPGSPYVAPYEVCPL